MPVLQAKSPPDNPIELVERKSCLHFLWNKKIYWHALFSCEFPVSLELSKGLLCGSNEEISVSGRERVVVSEILEFLNYSDTFLAQFDAELIGELMPVS